MPTYPVTWVDAFTTQPLSGNPCAVVFDADDLSDNQMLAITREFNLSETAFVVKSDAADIGARYFTVAAEIPMAGHPTISTIHALIETGRIVPKEPRTTIRLELRAGIIDVEIIAEPNQPRRIIMSQKPPQFMTIHEADEVLPVFGLNGEDLLPNAPVQTVSTGTPQLFIAVRDLEALRRVRLDLQGYLALREHSDFFSAHLFCAQGVTPEGSTFALHFGVPPLAAQDPFTGSATGGMAAYLWHHGLIDVPRFIAEQGHWMGRPGQASVEIIGIRDQIETVKVGGSAVTLMRGDFTL
jgi:trans-2,3-dihydro-3-hydroxyanthranilate isomerase